MSTINTNVVNLADVRRRGPITGRVTPPTNLQPAIDALSEEAREWLYDRCEGRDVTPRDIALAADYERNEL